MIHHPLEAPPPKKARVSARAGISAAVVAPAGYAVSVEPKKHELSKIDQALIASKTTEWHLQALRWPWDKPNLYLLLVGAALLALIAGGLLDVNTYSMHGMYRNRLIRAYLGASRWYRRPDPFTGFDPQDNLQMYQLRPELLWTSSFTNFDGFLEKLKPPAAATPNHALWDQLPQRVRDSIEEYQPSDAARNDLLPIVFGAINQLMLSVDLKTAMPATCSVPLLRKNRDYLESEFTAYIEPIGAPPPLHILNAALNLVGGDNLAWQQRKAESFTFSPLRCGSGATTRLGYRDAAFYGGARGVSLGTAMAISGAAVSPNQGYSSSAPVTLVMTLFNARLGWWLGNPGIKGRNTWGSRGPHYALTPLLSEAVGRTNDTSKYVFLSDGGHFENLGLYEMVRRRCRTIIVCDAAADEGYAFGELANAVRKIRVDFGIPIQFDTFCIGPDPKKPEEKREAAYCAVGKIRYGCVDVPRGNTEVKEGVLLYIKPVVYADCPADVRNYERVGKPFPQETTADQFFDETQFESYRALGSHIISRMGRTERETLDIDSFHERVTDYLKDAEKCCT